MPSPDPPSSRLSYPNAPRPIEIGVRHTGYPQDGQLWWVRWIDKVDPAGGGTGSPYVHVALSPLPEDADPEDPPTIQDALGFGGGDTCDAIALVHVGDMPALSPGLLVRDGKRAGWLKQEKRIFTFKRGQASDPIACRDKNPAERPAFWRADIPWKVLPNAAYPLGMFQHGRCVVVHDGLQQLVLPCSEVFRFFYAPETLLADALLRAPFDLAEGRLLNPEWTGPRDDGSFQVGLRSGLTERSAALLANLANGGKGAARRLRHLMVPGALSGSPVDGMIDAAIPYEWTSFRIAVQGLQLNVNLRSGKVLDKFLGLAITKIAWLAPPAGVAKHVHYRLDNDNTVDEPGEKSPVPYKKNPSGRPVVGPDGELMETSMLPPAIGSEPTFIDVPAAVIEGGPLVSRMPLVKRRDQSNPSHPRSTEAVPHVSSGSLQAGLTGAAALRYVQDGKVERDDKRTVPLRFVALTEALATLLARGHIESWTPISPGRITRNGIPVWHFPSHDTNTGRPVRWCNLLPGIYRARTALVVAIAIQHKIVHWVEIELRPEEPGYRSFVLLLSNTLETFMHSFLLDVARCQGKGPSDSEIKLLAGVAKGVRRNHGPDDDPFGGIRILNSLAAVMEK